MSEQPPRQGRTVEFSVHMSPSAKMRLMPPPDRAERECEPLPPEERHRGTSGGLALMRALTMTRAEKIAFLATQVDDGLLIYFALLTPLERREIIKAAELELKDKLLG